MDEIETRFKAVCLKLWGEQGGEETYRWIKESRPKYFHSLAMQAMTPIWEADRVDMRTKILCCIAVFTALNRTEVEFFMKMAVHHGIAQEEIEEVLLLTGLEAGFPAAEMAVLQMSKAYASAP